MSRERDPNHPIIDRPWEFKIIDFHYHVDEDSIQESYIDLTLKKDDTVRRLRFYGPQTLEVQKGFPAPTRGMAILDISKRQLDGLGIEVIDFESSEGGITFYAKNVVDLDLSE